MRGIVGTSVLSRKLNERGNGDSTVVEINTSHGINSSLSGSWRWILIWWGVESKMWKWRDDSVVQSKRPQSPLSLERANLVLRLLKPPPDQRWIRHTSNNILSCRNHHGDYIVFGGHPLGRPCHWEILIWKRSRPIETTSILRPSLSFHCESFCKWNWASIVLAVHVHVSARPFWFWQDSCCYCCFAYLLIHRFHRDATLSSPDTVQMKNSSIPMAPNPSSGHQVYTLATPRGYAYPISWHNRPLFSTCQSRLAKQKTTLLSI